jgi:hypothetical protein
LAEIKFFGQVAGHTLWDEISNLTIQNELQIFNIGEKIISMNTLHKCIHAEEPDKIWFINLQGTETSNIWKDGRTTYEDSIWLEQTFGSILIITMWLFKFLLMIFNCICICADNYFVSEWVTWCCNAKWDMIMIMQNKMGGIILATSWKMLGQSRNAFARMEVFQTKLLSGTQLLYHGHVLCDDTCIIFPPNPF